jgi:hypothetical protein
VTEEEHEETARRIAEEGRDALVGRLRPAFELAIEARGDTLAIDDQQMEQMVQRAADRADGLQWRRALASVASDQLGIGLGEALAHPAVVRAHELVGAPSYEEALSAVTGGQAPPSPPEAEDPEEPYAEHEGEPQEQHDLEPQPAAEERPEREHRQHATERLRLSAVHVGGIANLPEGAGDLELRFSDSGLDIAREGKALGRLTWGEITAIDTPEPTGRRRRRQQRTDGTIVIRSASGRAAFEVPGVSPEELREHIAPLMKDHLE